MMELSVCYVVVKIFSENISVFVTLLFLAGLESLKQKSMVEEKRRYEKIYIKFVAVWITFIKMVQSLCLL